VALTTQYDSIFRRFAGRLPVAYLRALAQRESGLRPDLAMAGSSSAARGLLQVVGVVREDYNKRHGTSYTADDLLDPSTNVMIAAELLNRIVSFYGKHADPNLQENWRNPEFVKLHTAGWNAGYSEGGGVQKVARYLAERGIPVTHDNVFRYAADAGAVVYLQRPERQVWQRSVADLYYLQPDRFDVGHGILTVALAVLIGWGTYRALRS